MNENKDSFLASLKKDLENDLNQLKEEKQEAIELVKKELLTKVREENEERIKKVEAKLKNFYYWLIGIALILLVIILGIFFSLRGSLGK